MRAKSSVHYNILLEAFHKTITLTEIVNMANIIDDNGNWDDYFIIKITVIEE